MKGLIAHALVFAFSVGVALAIWSRDEQVESRTSGESIEVWAGTPDSVERIRFESPTRTTTIEPRKDAGGRYYVVVAEKDETKTPPRTPPDAGTPHPPAPATPTTTRFVAVKSGEEFVEKLAPLTAMRRIGTFDPKRAEEFGLDKPEGTLKVKLRGAEQALVIGGSTPGGQERYAKHVGSNVVYAVAGELVQNVTSAEHKLLERELHAFGESPPTRLRISKGAQAREVVEIPGKKGAWASASSPTTLDETIGNWLAKVERLRVSEYVEKPATPLTPENAVLRIEYFNGSKPAGFLELHATPAEKGKDYFARTEHSRWYVKVLSSAGEQVEQDLASILK